MEQMSQTVTIFLASSAELRDDREKFEQFIGRKNKILIEQDRFIKLVIWEDFIDNMSKTRLQDEYNRAVRESDIFVMLFATKVGKYTREEFETAFGQFQESGKPWIYTYFKTAPVDLSDVSEEDFLSLKAFQKKLETLGHFWTKYDNNDALIHHFQEQLEKLTVKGLIDVVQSPKQDLIKMYRQAIAEEYATLKLIGFKRSFVMDSIYIPLTVHIDPEYRLARRDSMMEKLLERSLKAEDLPDLPEKVAVVRSEPGMGKTTMLCYLARRESIKADGLLPILIRLADFSKTRDPLETFLLAAVANYITGPDMQEAARKAIGDGQVLALLDGLDEVNREEYQAVTDRIRAFIAGHGNCRVIITSRKAGFQSHEVPYRLFEIDKLPFIEIENFVIKWFEKGKNDLAARIKANPRIHELAMNPFLLSIICVIFEKDKSLPQRRLELYQKCAETLLNLYNEKKVPKKNNFTQYDKEQVLKDIAYYFFGKGQDEFPYDLLIEQMRQNKERLKQNYNDDEMLAEICENSGLLRQSEPLRLPAVGSSPDRGPD
jgi:hypothetical protein